MYRLVAILLCTLVFASCKKQPDYSERVQHYYNISTQQPLFDSMLTVVTYNIQCGFPAGQDPWSSHAQGGATPQQIERLAQVIEQSNADIIMLQEVPLNRSNNETKDVTRALAKRLNMNYAYGAHGYNDYYEKGKTLAGIWGNAILSRYEITEIENREVLYEDEWGRRSVLRARIKAGAQEIDCYGLHHTGSGGEGQRTATRAFVSESNVRKIVGGDFNTAPQIFKAELIGMKHATIDSFRAGIDHIYVDTTFTVMNAEEVPLSIILPGPSDHPAVKAVIRW